MSANKDGTSANKDGTSANKDGTSANKDGTSVNEDSTTKQTGVGITRMNRRSRHGKMGAGEDRRGGVWAQMSEAGAGMGKQG
jgi:hypothetical protein